MILRSEELMGTEGDAPCTTAFAAGVRERRVSARRLHARERRVLMAVLVIWGLSMLDLGLTLAMTATSGMLEVNPIARAMVSLSGTVYSLVAWKVVWTGVATMILLSLRRRWKAEAAAWLCVAALGFTTITWVRYLECHEVRALTETISHSNAPREWMGGPLLQAEPVEAPTPRLPSIRSEARIDMGVAAEQPTPADAPRPGRFAP